MFTEGATLAMVKGVYSKLLFGTITSDRQVTMTRVASDPLFLRVLGNVPVGMTVSLDWTTNSLQGRIFYQGTPVLASNGTQNFEVGSNFPYSGDTLLTPSRAWAVTETPSTAFPATQIRMSNTFPDVFTMEERVAYSATVAEIRSVGPADLVGFYVRDSVGSYALASGDTLPSGVTAVLDWYPDLSYGRIRFVGRPAFGTAGSVKTSIFIVYYTDGINPDAQLATLSVRWQVTA